MKKCLKLLYIAVFFVLCALPLVLMPFVRADEQLEKRTLNKFPAYMENGRLNVDFSDGFEAWLSDRVPLRAQLLSCANLLQGELLHAESSNVIVGRDGWLFYNAEGADYLDTNALSDDELTAISITLSLIEENVEGRGGAFTFVPVPNKASVYGDYMPASYQAAEENNLTRLTERLKAYGVNFVDMRQCMLDSKELGVYHRRDSHWNYRGALLGWNAIMDSLGKAHETHEDAAYTVENNWRGDLDKLLYPAGGVMDEQIVYQIEHDAFRFTVPQDAQDPQAQLESFMSDKEERDMTFSTKNLDRRDGSNLLMVRDSFGRALLPYMIDSYETATFKRTDCPDLVSLEDGSDLVYEIVERNLGRVISAAPYMYAPTRESGSPEGLPVGEAADLRFEQGSYGLRLYGALPADAARGDGRICLRLERDGTAVTVEAFPICDSTRMGGDVENGFSAILSVEALGLSGDYQATVLAGGVAYPGGSVTVS